MVQSSSLAITSNSGATGTDRPGLGIGLMVTAMALASVVDGMCKGLALAGYHPVQVAWGRFLFIALALAPVVAARGLRPLRTRRPGLHLVRGLALAGGSLSFIAALPLMPLAQATVLAFATPFFVTALAIPLLGERVGVRRWAAVATGFAGVLVIVRPGTEGFQPASLLPVLSAAFGAFAMVLTRQMRQAEAPLTMIALGALSALAATSLAVVFLWRPLDGEAVLRLAGIGGVSAIQQWLLILAFRHAEPSLLAPYIYTQLLWASGVGWLLFGGLPSGDTLLGGAIIIGCGLYVWRRERRNLGGVQAARGDETPIE